MSTPAAPASPARSFRPSIAWERHKSVGIAIALIIMLIGGPFVALKVKSQYTAEAIFQVAPSYQKTMSADRDLELQSNSQYREFVNHLSRSLLRYDVLEKALADLKAKGIDPKLASETERKCIERLQRTVFVLAVADTYMVRVGLISDKKDNLHDIVNAIMDSFLETTRNEQIYGSGERGRVLVARAALVRTEIADLEGKRATLAGQLGLTTFGENTTNPFDQTLAQAREKMVLASIDRSRAQAMLSAFDKQSEVPANSGRSVLEMRLQDNGLQALRNEIIKRNEELQRVIAGLADGHPAKKPALEEQAELKQRMLNTENSFEQLVLGNTRARFLASLQAAQQVETELAEHVKLLERQTSEFAQTFREAMRITGEIKKREQELTDMRSRLNYLETESNALGFARLITPALPAITPQGLGRTRTLLAMMAASLALMFLVPTLIDFMDKRVITVGDAEKAMTIGSAAWLVEVKDTATRILLHDQFRRFASTLLRNHARGARNLFSFTSVVVGGGTTGLVLELARTLQELGSSAIVVDTNSLTTDSVLNADHVGMTDMLIGKASMDEVVMLQTHMDKEIPVVPYGLSVETGIQRLDRLKEALTHWREQYDVVLIDLPPLLPSADAELLIDAIGQVFLVAEAEVVKKADVVRARIQLEKMNPEAVGLVVNHVPLDSGGASMQTQLVETITRAKFSNFMSMSEMDLHWQLFRLRVSRFVSRFKR